MEIYTKRILTLSADERAILRAAASILSSLYDETSDRDYSTAEDTIMWAVQNSPFEVETYD